MRLLLGVTTPPSRLAWATDLHLDQAPPEALARFAAALRETGANSLLVTGDLSSAPTLPAHLDWIAGLLSGPAYVVLGNHDFWGGGMFATKLRVAERCARHERLIYLSWSGPVALTPTTALVGHDGWYDARAGNWRSTRVAMRDFRLIHEFARLNGTTSPTRGRLVRELADRAAAELAPVLHAALERFAVVIVATHVPPWWEAARHGPSGQRSHPDVAPFLVNTALGDVLEAAAAAHPGREIQVLAGHTHAAAELQVRPNLRCRVGGAAYGEPDIAGVLDLR